MQFYKQDGGKKVVNREFWQNVILAMVAIALIGVLISHLFWEKDDSYLEKAPHPPSQEVGRNSQEEKITPEHTKPRRPPRGISRRQKVATGKRRTLQAKKRPILVEATQAVIIREDLDSAEASLPTGTSAVGFTLHGIDTRAPDGVRAILPYGMAYKGSREIPRKSVLLGKASHQGNKIFINFDKVIFPDGREFSIQAHALDVADFTAGIKGVRHGNMDLKLAAAMGLSMVGTMGEVLAQKEALGGEYGRITVKSTLKDATLAGASDVAKYEAQRRLEATQREAGREYLTLESGKELIITLTETFRQKERR